MDDPRFGKELLGAISSNMLLRSAMVKSVLDRNIIDISYGMYESDIVLIESAARVLLSKKNPTFVVFSINSTIPYKSELMIRKFAQLEKFLHDGKQYGYYYISDGQFAVSRDTIYFMIKDNLPEIQKLSPAKKKRVLFAGIMALLSFIWTSDTVEDTYTRDALVKLIGQI